jgi:SNF2 family DNA or RNA helicase
LSDEDGIKSTIRLASSPKLEALIQKMGEIGSEKVVLFYEFTASGDLICDRLKAEKISFVRLWSGTEDKQGDFSKFLSTAKNSPRVLVAQWRLGGTGLDKMQSVSKYVMFFESPVSPIQRRQCEKRVHRIGQEQAVTVFDFCVEKSVDLKILEYIKEGKDLFDAIMDGDAEALW